MHPNISRHQFPGSFIFMTHFLLISKVRLLKLLNSCHKYCIVSRYNDWLGYKRSSLICVLFNQLSVSCVLDVFFLLRHLTSLYFSSGGSEMVFFLICTILGRDDSFFDISSEMKNSLILPTSCFTVSIVTTIFGNMSIQYRYPSVNLYYKKKNV